MESATPSNFRYQPLEDPSHIRVIAILPRASIDDQLFCVMVHVDPKNHGLPHGYCGLSYVWGDPKLPKKTMKLAYHQPGIENMAESHQLFEDVAITPSLDSALRYSRSHKEQRFLWADAICINQIDMAEREREVLKMGKIFSLATLVIAWLGLPSEPNDPPAAAKSPADEAISAAMNWFKRINDTARSQNRLPHELHLVKNVPALSPSELELDGMVILFNRPWFRRVWIIQEATLATGLVLICCGNKRIRIELLLDSIHFIYKYLQRYSRIEVLYLPRRLASFQYALTMFQNPEYREAAFPNRVLDALFVASAFQATIESDRLYGLLGLIGDVTEIPSLRPNYQKTRENFFTDLTRYLVEATDTAVVVSAFSDSPGLPSWTPTWNDTTLVPFFSTQGARERSVAKVSECGRYLHVNAAVLGLVCWTARLQACALDDNAFRKYLSDLEDAFSTTMESVQQPSRESKLLDLALGKTFVQFCVGDTNREEFLEIYRILIGRTVWPGLLSHPLGNQAEDERKFLDYLRETFEDGSAVFMTSTGYVGSSSKSIKKNDVLYWIPGCKRPNVFRKDSRGLRVVGLCYLYKLKGLTEDEHYTFLDNSVQEYITIV